MANKKYNQYDLSGEYGIGFTTKGEQFYFDLEDFDLIRNYTWYVHHGYLEARDRDHFVRIHKIILQVADKKDIDHINHNCLDNRKSNLRIYEHIDNSKNRLLNRNSTTKHKGVHWHKRDNVYQAQITVNKKRIYLGRFLNIEDAIIARNTAEKKYFGEYACNVCA